MIGKTWKSRRFNFLLNKDLQINFWTCDLSLSNCHACDNPTLKRPVIENNRIIDNSTPKLNMTCVGPWSCDRMPFPGRPDLLLMSGTHHLTKTQIQELYLLLQIFYGPLTLLLVKHLILTYWLFSLAVLIFNLIIQKYGLKLLYTKKNLLLHASVKQNTINFKSDFALLLLGTTVLLRDYITSFNRKGKVRLLKLLEKFPETSFQNIFLTLNWLSNWPLPPCEKTTLKKPRHISVKLSHLQSVS